MADPLHKSDLYTQHARQWRTNRYVYPVISRRSRGLSIGVNLNPDKACNFNCIYCCVDRTAPATVRSVDLDLLRAELVHLLHLASNEIWEQEPFNQAPPALRRLNDIAFSGDGEPTSFTRFAAACRLVVEEVEPLRLDPPPAIIVITNATLLHRRRVAEAMAFLDGHNGEIWAKLDAGTEAYYRAVERTTIPLARVLNNIRDAGRIRPIVIQSLFMKVRGQPPPADEIQEYARRLIELSEAGCQIKRVQVYTIARPAAETWAQPLEDCDLDDMAEQVKRTGLPVETYYGPA